MPTERWKLSEAYRRATVVRAREFRRQPTRSEQMLWQALRRNQLDGVKFRRQCPVGHFIVDFMAPTHRLIVEIDGPIHDQQVERDRERQHLIEGLGFRFLRVTSEEVEWELEGVLGKIRVAVEESGIPRIPPP